MFNKIPITLFIFIQKITEVMLRLANDNVCVSSLREYELPRVITTAVCLLAVTSSAVVASR